MTGNSFSLITKPGTLALALLLGVATSGTGPAFANPAAVGFEILVPHRAVYDVKLEDASDRSGIEGMTGRMVYEITGNECEGITVRYRFVTNINAGRDIFVTDQQMTTYEDPNGQEFSFTNKSFVNDQPDQSIAGSAESSDDGLSVSITKPKEQKFELDPATFISSHLVEVISRAKDGERFIKRDIYDGSGTADEVVASASVIGNPRMEADAFAGESEDAIEELKKNEAWPVSVSYFKKGVGNSGENLPIYEASFLLYDNGISRNVQMRYPDYTLRAQLSSLDYLDRVACN